MPDWSRADAERRHAEVERDRSINPSCVLGVERGEQAHADRGALLTIVTQLQKERDEIAAAIGYPPGIDAPCNVVAHAVASLVANYVTETGRANAAATLIEQVMHALGHYEGDVEVVTAVRNLRAALLECEPIICSYCCPSTWPVGEPQPHSATHRNLQAALAHPTPARGVDSDSQEGR